MHLKKRLALVTILLFSLILLSFNVADYHHSISAGTNASIKINSPSRPILPNFYEQQYASWHLESFGIAKELFNYGMTGLNRLLARKKILNGRYLTLIDFSKPSTKERLFVLDLFSGTVLFKTLVAHGKNSGILYAKSFSNKAESFESSPGFFITSKTYEGHNGYSLVLKGCEMGVNDQAESRAIVMHGAPYVSSDFINRNGFLGRSHGCPALPLGIHEKIINTIKNGSCIFAYAPNLRYLNKSALLR